jgi:uncharacterized membrane protein YdjX (TVP38/TMEM64 family)
MITTAKGYTSLIFIVLIAVISLIAYLWMIRQPFFEDFILWAQANFVLYFVLLVFVKVLAIVWPPLPGGILTMGSIPVIGWVAAYLAEALGAIIGASIAYMLGKRYGYSFLRKVLDETTIRRMQNVKIKKNKELEALFFVRLFSGGISEAISYGSGLMGVRYRNFFLATCGSILTTLPIFYFLNEIITGRNIAIYVPIVLVLAIFFWKKRGRYFE